MQIANALIIIYAMNELLTKYGISELKLACTLRKDEIAFKVPFNHNVCIYSSFMHEIWAFRETERERGKKHMPTKIHKLKLFCTSHMMHNTLTATIPMWYIIYWRSFEYFRVFTIILLYFCCTHFCCILLHLHKNMNCEHVLVWRLHCS